MKRSGRTVESEKSASATTTGQERARRKRTPAEGPSARLATVPTSALLARQRPDLDDADHEDDAHEQHAGRGGIAHVHVRERLVVDVELRDVRVVARAAVRDRVDVGEHE